MGGRTATVAIGALVCALGSAASAEEPEKRFTWHPSASVTFIADDQPYLEEHDEGAVGGWFSPNLELGYRAESYEIKAEAGADFRRYLGESDLSEDFVTLELSGEAGLYPGLTVQLSESFAPRPERISLPGDGTRNLQQTNKLDLELRYWRELPSQREILLTLRGTHFVGETFNALLLTDGGGVVAEDDFDPEHIEGALTAEFQSPLLERTDVYLRSQVKFRSFSESIVTDHADIVVMAGLRTRRFRNVEIDLAGGWGVISFEDRDNVHRFVGEGRLRYRLPNGWTLRVSAANRFVADLAGNNFVETTGRTGVQKYFGDDTSLSGAVFVSRLENDAWGTPKNWFGGVEVRGSHQFGRHVEVSLTYRHWRNFGDYSIDDFEQNRLALEFVYRR